MNFQNIPRTDKTIKAAFIPKLDCLLMFDYKAIELRVLAYFMAISLGDFSLAQEFIEGKDPHTESAKGIVRRDHVTDEERQAGKTLNFSMVYGGGAPTILRQLGADLILQLFPTNQYQTDQYNARMREQYRKQHRYWSDVTPEFYAAQKLVKAYQDARPGIAKLKTRINSTLAQRGYVKTPWGRHLHVQEKHKALNALVQGTAADLMRNAMRDVHRYLSTSCDSHIVNVVHDELILDCYRDEVPELVLAVPKLMDYEPMSKIVPIEVDAEVSWTNWAAKQPWPWPQGS